MGGNALWEAIGYWSHFGGAVICAILAIWVGSGKKLSAERKGACTALALTAAWALIAAASSPLSFWALLAESARNLGWMFLLYRLFESDGRHTSIQPIRPVLFVLAFLEGLQPALLFAQWRNLGNTWRGRQWSERIGRTHYRIAFL